MGQRKKWVTHKDGTRQRHVVGSNVDNLPGRDNVPTAAPKRGEYMELQYGGDGLAARVKTEDSVSHAVRVWNNAFPQPGDQRGYDVEPDPIEELKERIRARDARALQLLDDMDSQARNAGTGGGYKDMNQTLRKLEIEGEEDILRYEKYCKNKYEVSRGSESQFSLLFASRAKRQMIKDAKREYEEFQGRANAVRSRQASRGVSGA